MTPKGNARDQALAALFAAIDAGDAVDELEFADQAVPAALRRAERETAAAFARAVNRDLDRQRTGRHDLKVRKPG